MRLVRLTCALGALSLIACGGGGDDGGGGDGDGGNGMGGGDDYVTVSGVAPDHGTLLGGNAVIVSGSGFTRVNASPNMLLIDGRVALSVSVLTDTEIEVTMPPGTAPGMVDVTLFNNNGSVTLADAYSYNPMPTVTAVSPDNADYQGGDTVTLTGTGFQDFEPGVNKVWIGSRRATVRSVASDTSMTITAPDGGVPGIRDEVTVENDNGSGSLHGLLATTTGVVSFGRNFSTNSGQAQVLDISTGAATSVGVAHLINTDRPTSAAVGDAGLYLSISRSALALVAEGELSIVGPFVACNNRMQTLAFHGGTLYGICRRNPDGQRFGSIDVTTGRYTPLGGATEFDSQRTNLVSDGTNLYFIDGGTIARVNPADGTLTNVVPHTIGQPRGATFKGGTLYVLNRGLAGKGSSGVYSLYTLVPGTGVSQLIGIVPQDVHGLISTN